MTTGTSIFLIAVGAILRFAVDASISGFDIATAGTILIIIGIVGLLLSLLWMTTRRGDRADAVVVRDRPVVHERERVY